MPLQFTLPAAGQQKNFGCDYDDTISGLRRVDRNSSLRNLPTIGCPTNSTRNFGTRLRIPILLKRENAQKQIVIRRQLVRAARTRRPDLRRNELDDFRIPFRERIVRGRIP